MGDVFAGRSVPASCGSDQLAAFVDDADRYSVKLRFHRIHEIGLRMEPRAHPLVEVAHRFSRKRIVER